jgi:hypothetical protein
MDILLFALSKIVFLSSFLKYWLRKAEGEIYQEVEILKSSSQRSCLLRKGVDVASAMYFISVHVGKHFWQILFTPERNEFSLCRKTNCVLIIDHAHITLLKLKLLHYNALLC